MSADGILPSILQTKLFRPPIPEDYVPRQLLSERLIQVVQSPLTLVCAPAGYGKSALLSGWLEQCNCKSAWLSLDEHDNDLSYFEAYFLAALQSAAPSFGETLTAVLDGANLPPTRTFVEMLLDELCRLEENIVLMLDDYGTITNKKVHEFIIELMRHPHPNLHLALSTRYDPPLPLSEWRANNQLIEIRTAELRFSLDETRCFLQRAVDEQLDEETTFALNKKTEGWIAGLRLAALSFSRVEKFAGKIDEISGSNVYIRDYLASQVLTRLPAEIQLFLLQTSILDRLSASLCEAVIMLEGPILNAQAALLELNAANIFMIPLDDTHHWFRYHHLFDEFLQMRLNQGYSAEVVAALHSRASAWFAEHGFIEEALQHALTAGDMETAVGLVAANRQELMNRDHYQRLARWLHMFPESVVDESPDLLLIRARFAQIQRFDMVELGQIIEKVDSLFPSAQFNSKRAKQLLAENDSLRNAFKYYSLDAQTSFAGCRNGLEVLPKKFYALRSYCWIYGAVALQMMGDLLGAYGWIERGQREDLRASGGPWARNTAAAGFVNWIAADLGQMQRAGELMLQIIADNKHWHTLGWAHYFLACVHYQRNDLDSALYHAQKTFNGRYLNHASANVYSGFILALIEQAQGNPDKALEALTSVSDYTVEICSPTLTLMVQSFQAELAVRQGRAHELVKWEERACVNVQLAAMPFFYSPALTIPKVLLAIDTPVSRTKAADCLKRLNDFAKSTHNVRVWIEVLALKALLHHANDDEKAALLVLEESLMLAQPGGFIRLYVDLGPKIADLLRRLQNRGLYAAYINSILSAFAESAQFISGSIGNERLIEPLTEREMEILGYLARRFNNREIAAELVIAPATVKRHTINIYQKLNVHDRREAVEVAKALGLLPVP